MGLGMTDAEWEDLKSQVDDSFWVMRIIGLLAVLLCCPLPHLEGQGIHPSPTTTTVFLVVLIGRF